MNIFSMAGYGIKLIVALLVSVVIVYLAAVRWQLREAQMENQRLSQENTEYLTTLASVRKASRVTIGALQDSFNDKQTIEREALSREQNIMQSLGDDDCAGRLLPAGLSGLHQFR